MFVRWALVLTFSAAATHGQCEDNTGHNACARVRRSGDTFDEALTVRVKDGGRWVRMQ